MSKGGAFLVLGGVASFGFVRAWPWESFVDQPVLGIVKDSPTERDATIGIAPEGWRSMRAAEVERHQRRWL